MKILVVGGGGREHAIVWKLLQSPQVTEIICAPGNGGISQLAKCFSVKTTDLDGQVSLAKNENVDFVVVAPDDPLALGLVDRFEAEQIPAFGPRANAAIIEASKVFSKGFMQRHNIPTAKYRAFSNADEAVSYIRTEGVPIVVKADGLALGKGVIIAKTVEEAEAAVKNMMSDGTFGAAGAEVVIEEFMEGPEVTVLCFTDGQTICPMPSSRDHKRALDGDKGLNTGGMGAISPAPGYTDEIAAQCMEEIFLPTIRGMASEGREFKGTLYFGLMLTKDGPKVIEYNARFGDPETQVILPRLESDLFEIFRATVDKTLADLEIKWKPEATCCVVLASGGYPGKYKTGFEISGTKKSDGIVFHAGTRFENGKFLTAGGRVFGITAYGADVPEAVENAYSAITPISFENMHFRRDIGKTFG